MYTDHDDRDGESRNNNDAFLMHSFGISYNLNVGKDTDGDGVADKNDKCPKTKSGVKVDKTGCPLDTDGDGIADVDDKCPDVKGVVSAKGCPDKDGDGITDKDDKCPDVKGIAAMKGCPDADGDGITDAEDKCPDVKGTKELNGCVDTDGDGLIDSNDNCPTEKGAKELNGCPDKDADGVADKDDKCPDVVGIVANKGCPEIKEEVKQLFTKALQGIQFETGKDVITKGSYSILDNVVKVMVENPAYLLDINGHTDNVGDSNKNKTLSQNRANAVMNYLVSKGVASNRLKATGFGDTMPVGDNKTTAGKAKNRRVEFKVNF
jgi:outer membrane protein OmpA-like peptidoglycan-associated protein